MNTSLTLFTFENSIRKIVAGNLRLKKRKNFRRSVLAGGDTPWVLLGNLMPATGVPVHTGIADKRVAQGRGQNYAMEVTS